MDAGVIARTAQRRPPAEIRETHSGLVILLGDRAYKLKKPVDLGFLDFTSVAARRVACERELRLNRRLAPDVYLGLAHIVDSSGAVIDHLMVMRRMPAEARLATLVRDGAPVDAHLRALARLLADFHASARRGPDVAAQGRADALLARWRMNVARARQYAAGILPEAELAEVEALAEEFVAGRRSLLNARADNGFVVDGHGDLLAEDIFCLPDGPRVLDCLDFDDALRSLDVLDDIGCLAMDLERLGHADLGDRLVDWYAEFSGTPAMRSLRHHYVAYRAFVRAEVACIAAAQGAPEGAAEARRCADIALRHLRAGRVRLLLVGGAPGTGKSTLAALLADALDAVVLSTDEVRREFAFPPDLRYSAAATNRVYAEVLRRAHVALAEGEIVIADATWPTRQLRAEASRVAAETSSELVALECRLPVEISAQRAQRRHDAGTTASEADAAIARCLAASRHPWPDAVAVDATADPPLMLRQALAALGCCTSRPS